MFRVLLYLLLVPYAGKAMQLINDRIIVTYELQQQMDSSFYMVNKTWNTLLAIWQGSVIYKNGVKEITYTRVEKIISENKNCKATCTTSLIESELRYCFEKIIEKEGIIGNNVFEKWVTSKISCENSISTINPSFKILYKSVLVPP